MARLCGYIMRRMSTAQATSPDNNATLSGAAAAWGALLSMNLGAGLAKHLFPVIGAYGITSLRITLAALILCMVIHRGSAPASARFGPRSWDMAPSSG